MPQKLIGSGALIAATDKFWLVELEGVVEFA